MSALHDLTEAGQSIWIDNITRDLLDDGTIASYIAELSVTGLTSNPSIFDKAVRGSSAYDDQVASLAAEGLTAEEIFFQLAIDDLRRAADLFAPVHAATAGVDGWVSLEVSPLLADDTTRTVDAAISLAAQAGRDNLFIKIPGTPAGLPAIEAAIAAGVPVNVTLLFSTEQYLAAADAYLRGLEQRLAEGKDLAVHSVASLFISRWDVAVAGSVPSALQNALGLAIGAEAYAAYRSLLASDRVTRLVAAGAPIQRLLFASTGTKDPAAPDTLYVDGLVAPDTVNTMPDGTLHAFAEHGSVPAILPSDGGDAEQVLASISDAGVDIAALANRLQQEGKDAFVASWEELIAAVKTKGAR
jgi:transaldolase